MAVIAEWSRHSLRISLAVGVAAALLVAAVSVGYAVGRARQPATVKAAFVHFQLAPGWRLVGKTPDEVDLRSGAQGEVVVGLGDDAQDGVRSDSDVFRAALASISLSGLDGGVGSCLPLTGVRVGGEAGEETGFLFRGAADGGTSPGTMCELVWAHVQGGRYHSWIAVDTVGHLSQLVKATQAMQATAVWTN